MVDEEKSLTQRTMERIIAEVSAPLEARIRELEAQVKGADAANSRLQERVIELEAELARYQKALEGFTPGGSEFAGEPENCAEFVHARNDGNHKAIIRLKKQRDVAEANVTAKDAALAAADNRLQKAVDYHDIPDEPDVDDTPVILMYLNEARALIAKA